MKILGIAGSLRRASYNRALVEAARGLTPEGIAIEVFDLDDIPLDNADLDMDGIRPYEVERLKKAIAETGHCLCVPCVLRGGELSFCNARVGPEPKNANAAKPAKKTT